MACRDVWMLSYYSKSNTLLAARQIVLQMVLDIFIKLFHKIFDISGDSRANCMRLVVNEDTYGSFRCAKWHLWEKSAARDLATSRFWFSVTSWRAINQNESFWMKNEAFRMMRNSDFWRSRLKEIEALLNFVGPAGSLCKADALQRSQWQRD